MSSWNPFITNQKVIQCPWVFVCPGLLVLLCSACTGNTLWGKKRNKTAILCEGSPPRPPLRPEFFRLMENFRVTVDGVAHIHRCRAFGDVVASKCWVLWGWGSGGCKEKRWWKVVTDVFMMYKLCTNLRTYNLKSFQPEFVFPVTLYSFIWYIQRKKIQICISYTVNQVSQSDSNVIWGDERWKVFLISGVATASWNKAR